MAKNKKKKDGRVETAMAVKDSAIVQPNSEDKESIDEFELFNKDSERRIIGFVMRNLALIPKDEISSEYFSSENRPIFYVLEDAYYKDNRKSLLNTEFTEAVAGGCGVRHIPILNKETGKIEEVTDSETVKRLKTDAMRDAVDRCFGLPFIEEKHSKEKEYEKLIQMQESSYKYHLDVLRKYWTLRYFQAIGLDISHFYTKKSGELQREAKLAFDSASPQDVRDYFTNTIIKETSSACKNLHFDNLQSKTAGDDDTVVQYNLWDESSKPGPAYASAYLNSIFNWMQPGKLTIGSAGTNTGKTRMTLCNICYAFAPVYWDPKYYIDTSYDELDYPTLAQLEKLENATQDGSFNDVLDKIKSNLDNGVKAKRYSGRWMFNTNGIKNKCLYIGTEMDLEKEIEPMIQAYISNVSDNKIKSGRYYSPEEYERRVAEYKVNLRDKILKMLLPENRIDRESLIKKYRLDAELDENGKEDAFNCYFVKHYRLTESEEANLFKDGLTPSERERVEIAIAILRSNENIYLENIPNFNIAQLRNVIQRHVLSNEVRHVFFDYIHVTTNLSAEFTVSSGSKMAVREDQVLYNLGVELKAMCEEFGVSIDTWTQITVSKEADGSANGAELIRGAKGLADKADRAFILYAVNRNDIAFKSVEDRLRSSIEKGDAPNVYVKVYKNRDEYKDVCVFLNFDRGRLRLHDMLVTQSDKDFRDLERGIPPLYSNAVNESGMFSPRIVDYDAMLRFDRLLNNAELGDERKADPLNRLELKSKYNLYNKLPLRIHKKKGEVDDIVDCSDYSATSRYCKMALIDMKHKGKKMPKKYVEDAYHEKNGIVKITPFIFFRDYCWPSDQEQLNDIYEQSKAILRERIAQDVQKLGKGLTRWAINNYEELLQGNKGRKYDPEYTAHKNDEMDDIFEVGEDDVSFLSENDGDDDFEF